MLIELLSDGEEVNQMDVPPTEVQAALAIITSHEVWDGDRDQEAGPVYIDASEEPMRVIVPLAP